MPRLRLGEDDVDDAEEEVEVASRDVSLCSSAASSATAADSESREKRDAKHRSCGPEGGGGLMATCGKRS